jgi:orotate phosphoribosyltransferase
MKSVDDLIKKAIELKKRGLKTGEIADELNVSRETALWLISKTREGDVISPPDIHISWNAISSHSYRTRLLAKLLTDMLLETVTEDIDCVVGIAVSGIPLATMVAEELDCELAVFHPKKVKWEPDETNVFGSFSENFASVSGKNCIIVDDVISTGSTVKDLIGHITSSGGRVLATGVIVDKKGLTDIDGIPVKAMLSIIRL